MQSTATMAQFDNDKTGRAFPRLDSFDSRVHQMRCASHASVQEAQSCQRGVRLFSGREVSFRFLFSCFDDR